MNDSKHIVIDARIRRSSTGRYVDRLLEHLQTTRSNHRFTVLVQPDDPWKSVGMNFDRVDCPFPQFSFNPIHEFKFVSLLNNLKPDLVHFTMTQQPLTYRGKNVTTTHDLTMLRFVRQGKSSYPVFLLKKLGYRIIFLVAHTKTERVIVPTEFVKKDLIQHYPFTANKTVVTYESSEPPLQDDATPLQGVNKPFIMHVGSPFPHKNIQRLIEAFEQLDNPDLELVLAGKKEHYFEELEAWAKERASYNKIHFTGFIQDSELKWLYQNAEAYVLPSLSEGFGLPGLEAMAHGCPLISSNATCMPEVYGDAAEYFDPESVTDMAPTINKVLADDALKSSLVTAGYERIKHFSWQTMAEQTMSVYDSVLSDS